MHVEPIYSTSIYDPSYIHGSYRQYEYETFPKSGIGSRIQHSQFTKRKRHAQARFKKLKKQRRIEGNSRTKIADT
jgi:hypothetical protein